jgi:hypothetical protein
LDIRDELAAVLQKAADALRAGADAIEFSGLLYSPDLVVVGEGSPRAVRGVEPFLPDLGALLDGWGPNGDLTFTIRDVLGAGADAVTTLVDVYVAPPPKTGTAEYYRVIYAWKRTPLGWRVAAEMYTVGSF